MQKKFLAALATIALTSCAGAQTPQAESSASKPKPSAAPFTLKQILSAPYALDLSAAPVGSLFAWVENAEGVRNIWVGGPHETARKITPYTDDDAQDINNLAWSPEASLIAYAYGAPNGANGKPANPAHLQRDTAVHVIVQPLSGGTPIDLGEGKAPLFSHGGTTVYFLRSGEIYSALLVEGAKSAHRVVIDRGSANGLTLSPDGNLLAYVSHRGRHSFIGLFDLHAHTLTFVAPGTGSDFAPAFSPDGKQLAWLRGPFTEAPEFAPDRVSAYPWSIMLADVAHPDEGRAVFTPEKNKPGSVLPHLATGSPKVLWLPNNRLGFFAEMDKWTHFYAVSLNGGMTELLTPGESEVEDLSLSHDGSVIEWSSNQIGDAVYREKKGSSRLLSYDGPSNLEGPYMAMRFEDDDRRHVWRLDLTKPNALPERETVGSGIEAHPAMTNDGTVAVLASDSHTPMHPALVNKGGTLHMKTGVDDSIVPLSKAAIPSSYPLSSTTTPRRVLIPLHPEAKSTLPKDDVRVSLHGQLFLPPSTFTGTRPALLFFHGGPERQMLLGYPSMEYYSNAFAMNQYLASRGFVVLSVNYHCGIGYGVDFRQCVHSGADGASEYADVLAARHWITSPEAKKIVDVDPKRVGIWGGSYGGLLTAQALARNSDLFAAGVDFHGVHEWILEDNNADWLKGTLAEQQKIVATAHASSPMGDIAKWRSPVLLIHGDNDGNVAFNQTPMLADALRARNVHVEELIFPDEIHEFLLHKDWLKAYTAEAAFFERILKP